MSLKAKFLCIILTINTGIWKNGSNIEFAKLTIIIIIFYCCKKITILANKRAMWSEIIYYAVILELNRITRWGTKNKNKVGRPFGKVKWLNNEPKIALFFHDWHSTPSAFFDRFIRT